ncbi:hypothetical protein LTR08_007380 [Meristemomyces frigidus]|nr:hypothetical protein LTR08_007380 [Meristemomyces frigidus]
MLHTEGDSRKVKQAYRILKDEVVARATVIITTVYVAKSESYAKFGSMRQSLFYFLDEAPTVAEASALIPLACAEWSPKVVMMLLFGDVKQLRPFVYGNYFNPCFSQLELSLHKRLVDIGYIEHVFRE